MTSAMHHHLIAVYVAIFAGLFAAFSGIAVALLSQHHDKRLRNVKVRIGRKRSD